MVERALRRLVLLTQERYLALLVAVVRLDVLHSEAYDDHPRENYLDHLHACLTGPGCADLARCQTHRLPVDPLEVARSVPRLLASSSPFDQAVA